MDPHHARSQAADQRPPETFAKRRMRCRRPIPIAVAAAAALMVMLGCDITQEHIDQASEALANATRAIGSMPTATEVSAGSTLQSTHLAGSSWRWIYGEDWPNAHAVVTLGTNGRLIWHMYSDPKHPGSPMNDNLFWRVSGGRVGLSVDGQVWQEFVSAGVRVDQNTVCIAFGGQRCHLVMQRVTP